MATPTDTSARPRPKKYGYLRLGTLSLVYLLMGIHIAHWKFGSGKTLAPLELNEVMHTLELGIITAGFILMAVAVLSVLIVGRFFCSWGCHILALQDLSAWLLDKVGIHPKPVRLRTLVLVGPGAMVYMFVWPQVKRVLEGRELPILHITSDQSGWASFMTDDFARNLPGLGMTIVTFIFVGFVTIYFLGSRSFCRYACPYGALFSIADRIAPGNIVAKGDRVDCASCGICTAKCESNIRVHEELTVFGQIVDPSCLKDLDCISNCPNGSIGFGFTKPALFKSWTKPAGIKRPRYDFTIYEEVLLSLVFFAVLLSYRGLYGLFPFLLTLAMGVVFAYCTLLCLRLIWKPQVRLNNFQLKIKGKVTKAGFGFVGLVVVVGSLSVHSGIIRYHEHVGWRAVGLLEGYQEHHQRVQSSDSFDPASTIELAIKHLSITDRWGLYHARVLGEKLGELHVSSALMLAERSEPAAAIEILGQAAAEYPDSALVHHNLGGLLAMSGRTSEAITEYENALKIDQGDADTWNTLGFLLFSIERFDNAEYCFRASIDRNSELAHPHYNLARLMAMLGKSDDVRFHIERAAQLDPQTYSEALDRLNQATQGP